MNDDLLRKLKREIQQNPGDAGAYLRAITDGLDAFQSAIEARRGAQARNALLGAIGSKRRWERTPLPVLLDIAFAQFPTGIGSHAPVEASFWADFIQVVQREGVDLVWVQRTRGDEVVRWLNTYVLSQENV